MINALQGEIAISYFKLQEKAVCNCRHPTVHPRNRDNSEMKSMLKPSPYATIHSKTQMKLHNINTHKTLFRPRPKQSLTAPQREVQVRSEISIGGCFAVKLQGSNICGLDHQVDAGKRDLPDHQSCCKIVWQNSWNLFLLLFNSMPEDMKMMAPYAMA